MTKAKNALEFGMLAGLIREYYSIEQDYKDLDERRDYLNTTIKQLMKQCDLEKYVVDDLKATLQTSSRRSLKKGSVLGMLKKLGFQEDEIAAFYDTTEVLSLRVTKLEE